MSKNHQEELEEIVDNILNNYKPLYYPNLHSINFKGTSKMPEVFQIGDAIELINGGFPGSIEEIYNSEEELPDDMEETFTSFPVYEILYLSKANELQTCFMNEDLFRRAQVDLSNGLNATMGTGLIP